jgi:hypothetical protein
MTHPKSCGCRFTGVNSGSAKLLQAALGILGTEKELASRLGIGETLLGKFMADLHPLPTACFFGRPPPGSCLVKSLKNSGV